MNVQIVILALVFCGTGSHAISRLDYQHKINTLQHLIILDCKSYNRLGTLPTTNINLLKARYYKLVQEFSACHRTKGKYG